MRTNGRSRDPITSAEELRAIIRQPSELAVRKQIDALDEHCRQYIALSPFLLLATSNAAGDCDVSPRGDAPGFVQVLDERTLLLPERPGNRRLDSLNNILENPHAAALFIIPGVEETLRVNGRAQLVRDADLLEACAVQGKPALIAIALHVEEAFLHCPKCFKRSNLWDTSTWPARSELPSFGKMMVDQLKLDVPVEVVDRALEEDAKKLY